ncbi:MAG: biotin/lipoyl-binding protein [Chloroflexi bacterium]|nr:MAG: biotin/lipoyl-binding protein [Chloroflexota bacterium]MBL1196311.1 biotin/lipoyl-binding protein [Chloroflexota bacterium]NOH13606.1 NeuD/PglB/VioB family sugar acetyltransferase [Chloroflexota bacterium]
MPDAKAVLIPLINPNEAEALLAGLHVQEGDEVKQGDLLCTLETTKSASELEAEQSGFVVGLAHAEGETVTAGDLFCYLADSADWVAPEPKEVKTTKSNDGIPEGLRISQPALKLAQAQEVDLSKLPTGPMVTEGMVRGFMANTDISLRAITEGDAKQVIVYGGGGHGKACIELLQAVGKYEIAGVVDDGMSNKDKIWAYPILGGGEDLQKLYEDGTHLAVNAVGGIGDISSRMQVFQKLAEAGFAFPTVAHPSAVVEGSAEIEAGVQVFPLAYIGSDAVIWQGSIINTGAIISHDCKIRDFSNISPGAILAGGVEIGERSLIGMGATINLNVKVGTKARIGNGATVKADVPDGGIVPAGAVWPK